MPFLVDSHCHLDFPDFGDEQDSVVARATAQGVRVLLTICTRISQLDRCLSISRRFPSVYCSVGTHPHNARESEEHEFGIDHIIALTADQKIVAIGESGLDFYRNESSVDDQYTCFRKHIAAAQQTGLPLVIHSRQAEKDTIRILREEMKIAPFQAVLHCFSSKRELAEVGIELGFYISFSGILTFKSSHDLHQIAKDIPSDRLLVETDSPYLAPAPYRGKRNEPAYVYRTAEYLASLRGVSLDEISSVTTENFFRLFSKVEQAK